MAILEDQIINDDKTGDREMDQILQYYKRKVRVFRY